MDDFWKQLGMEPPDSSSQIMIVIALLVAVVGLLAFEILHFVFGL